MECKKHELFQAYMKLLEIGYDCSKAINHECQIKNLTNKQIHYLKIIDENNDMTFSKLADFTSISKPTVTEMINKFILCDCVYKEKSDQDKRVCYIHLTTKGRRIARAEELTQLRLIERIESCLDENEINLLIDLLNKLN
ncbi:MAG: MarR family winged helix-turn-helix transcriptional regulator [Eubacterium sp.]